MVNFQLMITAELENLTDLQPQNGCDDPNFSYFFKVSTDFSHNCLMIFEHEFSYFG